MSKQAVKAPKTNISHVDPDQLEIVRCPNGQAGPLSDQEMLRAYISRVREKIAASSGCGGCPVESRVDEIGALAAAAEAALTLAEVVPPPTHREGGR